MTTLRRQISAPKRLESVVQQLVQRFSIVGIWAAMAVVFAVVAPTTFLTRGTGQTIFGSGQPLVFLAVALVVVFVVGEFDISVPSILGLSATMVPVLNVDWGLPIAAAVALAFLGAVAVGLVNGVIVVILGVDPFAATLGMGTLLIGIAYWMTNLTTAGGLDASYSAIATLPILGLPISFYYGVALVLLVTYILWRTPLGRHMTFIGANREVARLAGIQVNRIRIGAYLFSSIISGVGGIVLVLGIGGFDPGSSATYLLPAFAAAILSTAVITPGRYNPIGALIAIYFLNTGVIGLQLLGVAGWITQVFFGGALVVAVTVSTLIRRYRTRG